jgi:hypothetical protein
LKQRGEITWPTWWDGNGFQGPIACQWAIHAMPTMYVLDREGVIRNKGFLQPDQLSGTVDMLLKEMGAATP